MESPIKKNEEYIVEIIDSGSEGEGIAKINNFTIFIPGAIIGETVKIHILKVNSSYAFAKIIEIIKESEYRVETNCSTYTRCGGCNLRHIKYEETLNMKRNAVQSLVNKTLTNKIKVKNTIGMENPYHYRNKAQYPVGIDKDGKSIIGVFANRTHNIIPMVNCQIQDENSEKIAKFINEYINQNKLSVYDEKTGKGIFRHIVIKVGKRTNEIMCIFVINGDNFKLEKELVQELVSNFSNIKTIVKNINKKNTNVILGDKNITLDGDGYITDKLGEYTFKISPMSFYQINPIQTEKLYSIAVEKANLTGKETILDLYCGIGTIGIFASKYVKKLYGIEIVEQAIEDAKENAKINNVTNAEFFAGDVEQVLEGILQKENVTPDVIFVDPPRKGLDNTTIKNILKVSPKRVVYISCNPATLVRDLKMLEEQYEISEIQPVDMFPFTSHVECVTVMDRAH